ncbi:hypothetical protein GYMLUDRAFT_57319 [Collybiopsis luxurians FD-317 M1]|uniref:Amidohydrolase-related domain-containing protein n=1 Tax=Collybiopsis luxurians FD-317 M1 TaxID=944289 RepID=A0A0D0BI05_9AGAR|nr:hypothetical protein GYMLUDRAFT_57319 [Collybiopsis luxurians FD-317 M1]
MRAYSTLLFLGFAALSEACGNFGEQSQTSCLNRSIPKRTKTAITNVGVFDGSTILPAQTVIFDGESITSDPSNIETFVDGTGKFLIPGLMDSHVHPGACDDLSALASFGVTTAFLMSCENYTQCDMLMDQEGLTDIIRAGHPAVGPNSRHAQLGNLTSDQLLFPDANLTATVDYVFGNGSDFFKITAELNGPTQEQQNELVLQVHALGKQTMTHASTLEAYTQAIASGTDGIQHVFNDGLLNTSLISEIKSSTYMFITPTMEVFRIAYAHPELLFTLQGNSTANTTFASRVQPNVKSLYEAGIPLLAGTDAVGDAFANITGASLPYGLTLHCELENFVEIGMTPSEALRAATVEPAYWHRLRDRGVIRPGLKADLVLLNSNPLQNISNARDIARVWVNGIEYSDVAAGSEVNCASLL